MMFSTITDLSYLFIKSTSGKVCIYIRMILFEVLYLGTCTEMLRFAAGGPQPSGGL